VPRSALPHQAQKPPAASLPTGWHQRILHLDEATLILDKPAGLPVHAGPRGGTSLTDWLPALRLGKRRDPQPAHRLDTDTAGCLALGRTAPAIAALNALFAQGGGGATKTYWTVLQSEVVGEAGTIDAPLRKISSAARGWRMEVHASGQPARTAWRVMGRAAGLTWLELTPQTGRTHQLRIHCAARLGGAIQGDPVYGTPAPEGLQLLARQLTLALTPVITATAPVPPHMRAALTRCGWPGEAVVI
jgi:23S rRNA-/tRNA-specific pseudouridylate synthase